MVIVSVKTLLGLPGDAVAVFEEMRDARKETRNHLEYWGYKFIHHLDGKEIYEMAGDDDKVMERLCVAYTETAGGTFFNLHDIGVE